LGRSELEALALARNGVNSAVGGKVNPLSRLKYARSRGSGTD